MWHKFRRFWQLWRDPDSFCACAEGRTCVGFAPWWPSTYYQARLARELEAQGLSVHPAELSLRTLICLMLGRDCHTVVHMHWPHGTYLHNYWHFPFVILHLWLYRALKNNIVWTVHELEFYETRYPLLDRIMVYVLTKIARALIVHSEYSAQVMRSRYRYPRDIVLLRHPGYVGCFPDGIGRAAARAQLKLPSASIVYLFLGFVKPYKGIEDLINAYARLDDMESRLLIVGKPLDEETRNRIETLAGWDSRIITHLRFVPDDRLQLYMNAADVSVFPFRKMHTSGSVHLAMSYGRPVIAPAIASLPEEVNEASGLLFDPRDPDGLYMALRAARGKDLRAMGRCARLRLEGRSWPTFASQHLRLYERLARRSAPLRAPSR